MCKVVIEDCPAVQGPNGPREGIGQPGPVLLLRLPFLLGVPRGDSRRGEGGHPLFPTVTGMVCSLKDRGDSFQDWGGPERPWRGDWTRLPVMLLPMLLPMLLGLPQTPLLLPPPPPVPPQTETRQPPPPMLLRTWETGTEAPPQRTKGPLRRRPGPALLGTGRTSCDWPGLPEPPPSGGPPRETHETLI